MASDGKIAAADEQAGWLITGCPAGFDRDLAEHLLSGGSPTVVTARSPDELTSLSTDNDPLHLKLDASHPSQVDAAPKSVEGRCGEIDVLVNKSGLGHSTAAEEGENTQTREMCEVNVLGSGKMLMAVLPGMSQWKSGLLVNRSSIGGLKSAPTIKSCNKTEFAIEGATQAVWQEVEPGAFQADWAGRSANESKVQVSDYAATAGAGRKGFRTGRDIIKAMELTDPPHRLSPGNDAYDGAMAEPPELCDDFAAWKAVARGTNFPKAEQGKAA